MPEPAVKPPSPVKLVGIVAAVAAAVALLLLWLILRPPPSQYRTPVAIVAIAGIVTGAVLILASLVRLVEHRFTIRYDCATRAQHEHRQFVQAQLASLVAHQKNTDALLERIAEVITDIDDRTQKNCKHIKTVETQVGRCMSEIGIVSEQIDELREAFVEEGLPQD